MKRWISIVLVMLLCFTTTSSMQVGSAQDNAGVTLFSVDADECVIIAESETQAMEVNTSSLCTSGVLFSNFGVDADTSNISVSPDGVDLYTYNLAQDVFDSGVGYQYHNDAIMSDDAEILINDYSEEEISISGEVITCGSLVGAAGEVALSATNLSNDEENVPINIMSLNDDITIYADQVSLYGLIYAPNGTVEINADEFSFAGVIIADTVIINANTAVLFVQDVGYEIKFYSIGNEDLFDGDIMYGTAGGSSGSNSGYYYNTDGKYKYEARYDKYHVDELVKVGDIVYEGAGGYTITGHIAIVYEFGTRYEVNLSTGQATVKTFPNVIEAIDCGVCIGLLDDQRLDDRFGTVLRIQGTLSNSTWNTIKRFLQVQKGKKYAIHSEPQSDINTKTWYCSELAWAAYKYGGIKLASPTWIRVINVSYHVITPRSVRDSAKLFTICQYR